MKDEIPKYFGLLLAFVLPGFVGLWALSYFEPTLGQWFSTAADKDTSVGSFFFVVLASIGMGVFVSGLRWLLTEAMLPLFPAPRRSTTNR